MGITVLGFNRKTVLAFAAIVSVGAFAFKSNDASAHISHHPKHLGGPSAPHYKPSHGHRVGTLYGGVTSDGGGFALHQGTKIPVSPMGPASQMQRMQTR